MGSGEAFYLRLVIDAAATTQFTFYGAQVEMDWRM